MDFTHWREAHHIAMEKRTGKITPLYVEIIPSYQCNLKCEICGQWEDYSSGIEGIMEDLTANIHIDGGERQKIEELVRSIGKNRSILQEPWRLNEREDFSSLSDDMKIVALYELLKAYARPWREFPAIGDTAYWRRIASSLREMNVPEVTVTGGDPLVFWPTTKAIIEELSANKGGPGVTIITNGTLLDEEKAAFLVEKGVERVIVSLDGARAETNDAIRGKGSFEMAVKGLRALKEVKERAGSHYPELTVAFVITSANYRDIADMIEFSSRWGAVEVKYSPYTVARHGGRYLRLNSTEEDGARVLLRKASVEARKRGIRTNAREMAGSPLYYEDTDPFVSAIEGIKERANGMSTEEKREFLLSLLKKPQPDNSRKDWYCYEPYISGYISPQGGMAPCCFFRQEDFVDIGEGKLDEVYASDKWKALAEKVNYPEPYISCRHCHGWPEDRAKGIERAMRFVSNPLVYYLLTLLWR